MANTVVGGAAVEITMDLSRFGTTARSQITDTLGSSQMRDAITSGLDRAANGANQAGHNAGQAAGQGIAAGVRSESSNITTATRNAADNAGNAAESSFRDHGHRAASAFAQATKLALLGAAGGVAVGIAAIFKTGIGEQTDFLKGQGQLQAGLKSTGNAANTTVDHLEDLASSIQNYSGQTDDSIVASEQLLLTFTGIQNQAGKNNDIFDQTVKISADMAARMGGDASASAIQLGKALNDPVAGISALARVGVTFTDQQKAQITAMVAAGNTMGAQKVILGELNKEFGGSAKAAGDTLPGQMTRARRSFEDVSQSIIASLMPGLVALGGVLTKYVMPAFQTAVAWVIANWPKIQAIIVSGWTTYIQPVIMAIVGVFRDYLIPAITAAVEYVIDHWPQIEAAFALVWRTIKPIIDAWVGLMKTLWTTVLQPIVAWVVAHWSQIKIAMEVVFVAVAVAAKVVAVALTIVFNTIAVAIRVLATVIGWLYSNVFKPTFELIVAVVKAAIAVIKPTIAGLVTAFEATWRFLQAAWRNVGQPLFDAIKLFVTIWVDILKVAFVVVVVAFAAIWAVLKATWDNVGKPLFDLISSAVSFWWHNVIEPVFGLFQAGFSALWSGVKTIWDTVGKPMFDAIEAASRLLGTGLKWAYDNVLKPVGALIGDIWTGIRSGFDALWGGLADVAGSVAGPVIDMINGLISIINDVIDGLNKISITIPHWSPIYSGKTFGIDLPHVPSISAPGNSPSYSGTSNKIKQLADGATVLPSPGGTVVRVSEAGKAETIVDAGEMNRLIGAINKRLDNRPATQFGDDGHRVNVEHLEYNVHNPVPETVARSEPASMRRLANALGGL